MWGIWTGAVLALLSAGCGRVGFDTQVASDGQTAATDAAIIIDADVAPFTATHRGWTHVRATGPTTPKASTAAIASRPLFVEFAWAPIDISPATTVDQLKIYRAEAIDGTYAQIASIAAEATRFTDTTAASGTTYFYRVRPSIGDFVLTAGEADATLEVPVPLSNSALVHRWMVNREVCELLGEAIDRENNYRCAYTGPGRVGYAGDIGDPPAEESFYDIGDHHQVDQFEMGCNYTLLSSGCPDTDGAPGVCLGTAAQIPNDVAHAKNGNLQAGNEGDVFYDRGSSRCWLKNASAWVAADAGATDTWVTRMASNAPGLPPLVRINQLTSREVCKLQGSPSKRRTLLSRKLHIGSSAWPLGLSDAEIEDIEAAATAASCNTDLGHSGTVTFDDQIEPANYASLPATAASATYVMRTGDPSTTNCQSRYGIHSLAGNVWEWTSDQLTATSSGLVLTGIPSNLDASNRDFADVSFSRNTGTGGGEWRLDQAPSALPALGLPTDATGPSWFQARAIAEVATHGDGVFMDEASDGTRGAYVGGSTSSGSRGGRFAINLSRPPDESHERIGFRCAYPMSP